MRFAPALAILASVASLSHAAEQWLVTDAEFNTRSMSITALDDSAAKGNLPSGEEKSVALTSFVQATRNVKIEQPKGLILFVAGGDRLIGQPKALDGSTLVWFASGIGEVPVPIERALGILRDEPNNRNLLADRGEDELRLANGDVVKGIVTGVAERAITIGPTGGNPLDVPAESVRQLLFATPPGGRAKTTVPGFVVRLTTGTIVSCDKLTIANDQVKLTFASGASASVPSALVAGIEHTNGPVAWLSSRTPAESTYTPFLDAGFVPQMDRAVTGEPLRFAGQTYVRGIGLHSKSRLIWQLEPGDKSFRTRYAIDPSLGYADVDVRILVDEKVVHEQKHVKAATLSPVIKADLKSAKTLTIEVDYGAGYDIQDRVMFLEPAIVR